jgi:hypothetical protein
LLNKRTSTSFERKHHIVSATFLVFVDAGENLIITMPLNPPVSLIQKEELEEALLNMNVSQWSYEE